MEKRLLSGKHFWLGDIACAEGAIAAGCNFFAGYPITPASEIAERMAERLPKVGGVFVQMEDELASISAVIGASWAGAKAMTATSGPGFSLMQEGIGYAYMTETPCVIVNVMRVGPSTGQATKGAQGDVMQARWGTHGDHMGVTLCPNSAQEMFDYTVKAFNIAEMLRVPVILLSDGVIGHIMEPVIVPDKVEVAERKKPSPGDTMFFGLEDVAPMPEFGEGFNVLVTGSTHDERGIRHTTDPDVHRRVINAIVRKVLKRRDEITFVEKYRFGEGVDIAFISYGCTSRAVYEAVRILEGKGVDVAFLRLITIWPFPEELVRELGECTNVIIVPEMNLGQISDEVKKYVHPSKVYGLHRIGGGEIPRPEEIAKFALEVLRSG